MSNNPTMKSVELTNIVKKFGSFTAVDDVSINIKAGNFVLFLGHQVQERRHYLKLLLVTKRPQMAALKSIIGMSVMFLLRLEI